MLNLLKKTIKKMFEYIYITIMTIYSFIIVILRSKFIKFDKTEKSNLYVLGSGPSLGYTLENKIEKLLNKDIVAVNYMATTKYFEIIKPKYYILFDPVEIMDRLDDFIQDVNTREKAYKTRKNLLEIIKVKTKWKMIIFLPMYASKEKEIKTILENNRNIKIQYINTVVFRGFDKVGNWLRKKSLVSFFFQNCILTGIYIGIMNNYKKIFILGAEHDWIKNIEVNDKNQLILNDLHFYDGENNKRILEFNMIDEYRSLYLLYKEYMKIKQFSEYMNCKIYNATNGGLLDIFERTNK